MKDKFGKESIKMGKLLMINLGKKNGQGTKTWTNGDMYEGKFKVGKYHGQGTYTWSDGRKYVGEWKNKEKWNGIGYDKNGDFVVRFVNGKQIEQ